MNYDHVRHGLRGMFFNMLGQTERARAAYLDSHRADPTHAATLRTLGWLEARLEHWPAAEAWFARAVDLEPNDAHAWFNLGYVRDKGGMDETAVAALKRATELDPNNDRAWYGLGMLHARHGRHAEAAAALAEAGRLQPMNGLAWYALGMAWHHCNEPDKVAEVIEHTLSHDPQTAQRLIRDTERSDYAHRLG
ncbi:MAG: tetratricopeptide repeat protein [Thiobacillus sp.]|nr:tetratricopeptide repeat protein [Thiobacillus sp.]